MSLERPDEQEDAVAATRRRHLVVLATLLGAAAVTAVVVWFVRGRDERQALTVVAAADIACDPEDEGFNAGQGDGERCRHIATSDLALQADPDLVLLPGDTQYESGELDDYLASFDPTWGRMKELIRAVPGDHEYEVEDAAGFFSYFDDAAGASSEGYYSFQREGWQFLAVNSMCEEVGGCEPGDPQYEWLQRSLEEFNGACQLAFWHHPRWSNGNHDDVEAVAELYTLLYEHGVELLLAGDSHNYQRFVPLDPRKQPDERGVRQFVVGAGGRNMRDIDSDELLEAANDEHMGVLVLQLFDEAYSWEFRSIDGGFADSGAAVCHR